MTMTTDLGDKLENLGKELEVAMNGFPASPYTTLSSTQVQHCEKHGEFTEFTRVISIMPIGGKQHTAERKTRCPDCIRAEISQLETQKQERDERAKKAKIERLKWAAEMPKRFAQASFESYHETAQSHRAKAICKAYADRWQERKASGGGLILCGKPGTGKNHLACAIVNHVIEQHQDEVILTTALRLARSIKSTWGKEATLSEADAVSNFIVPDLLVIDEIGVQFGSEAEKIILFEIINSRYEEMKPTILISNLSETELGDYVGERVIDRMREGKGAVVTFDWESYRK